MKYNIFILLTLFLYCFSIYSSHSCDESYECVDDNGIVVGWNYAHDSCSCSSFTEVVPIFDGLEHWQSFYISILRHQVNELKESIHKIESENKETKDIF